MFILKTIGESVKNDSNKLLIMNKTLPLKRGLACFRKSFEKLRRVRVRATVLSSSVEFCRLTLSTDAS